MFPIELSRSSFHAFMTVLLPLNSFMICLKDEGMLELNLQFLQFLAIVLALAQGQTKKIIVYRPNQYELVNWVLVKQKKHGWTLSWSAHVPNFRYFQNGRFSQWSSEQKNGNFSKYGHITYYLKAFFCWLIIL